MNRENPIILALDEMGVEEVYSTAEALREVVGGVKVNDLLDAKGVPIVRDLKDMGLMVMADPKIKDIPRTVGRRVGHYVEVEADFVTILADNSGEALIKAAEATAGSSTRIVAVTVLTSINEEECNYIYGVPTKAGVLKFARMAVLAGIPAVVCSPNELAIIKGNQETSALICITPGIRLAEQETEDQKRVNTPGAAIKAGAEFLVIGSAILKAGDGNVEARKEAASKILDEINKTREET